MSKIEKLSKLKKSDIEKKVKGEKPSYFIRIDEDINFKNTSYECEVKLEKGDFVFLHPDKEESKIDMIEFEVIRRTYIVEVKQWIFRVKKIQQVIKTLYYYGYTS